MRRFPKSAELPSTLLQIFSFFFRVRVMSPLRSEEASVGRVGQPFEGKTAVRPHAKATRLHWAGWECCSNVRFHWNSVFGFDRASFFAHLFAYVFHENDYDFRCTAEHILSDEAL